MQDPWLQWQQTQLDALLGASDETQCAQALFRAARTLGFDYCAYGMRQPLPLTNPRTTLHSNYAPEWQARYAEQNYVATDPTVAHALRSVLPLVWSDEVFAEARPLWEEARAHGLQVGWAQSTFDARGTAGMLTLARSHDALSDKELAEHGLRMSWLAQAAHQAMSRLIEQRQGSAEMLTQREAEVLRWTADGKTSGEVGEIMQISERTVNFHVNNAITKLGVANKTAAVIKAAMLRLL